MLHLEVRNMEQIARSIDGNTKLKEGLRPDLVNVDYYIQMTYGDLRVDNQLLKDAIKEIDDTEADGLTIISEYIGGSGIYDLSTGCKGLIVMWHQPEMHTFCARFYGDNCAKWIYKIAYGDKKYGNKPRDIRMVVQSYMPNVFEYFTEEDEVEIEGKIYRKKDNPGIVLLNTFYEKAVFETEQPFEIDWNGIDKSKYTQEEIDRLIRNKRQPMKDMDRARFKEELNKILDGVAESQEQQETI